MFGTNRDLIHIPEGTKVNKHVYTKEILEILEIEFSKCTDFGQLNKMYKFSEE